MKFILLAVLPALAAAIVDNPACAGGANKSCFATADCGISSGFSGAVACKTAANTPAPTTTPPSAAAACVDLLNPITGVSDCPARVSLCANTVYRDVMRVQCPKTCGFCTSSGTSTTSTSTSTTCVDLLNPITGVSDCPARASLCADIVYRDVMRVQCPRTCGFCTSSGTSTTSTSTSTTCIDLLNPITGVSDCPARASLCADTVYRDVMRVQCPKTCGFCPTRQCPSVPQAAGATGYFVSGLKGPTIQNGATVFTCTAPEKLLSIVGGVVTELAAGATIKCIPNSGLFTTDDGLAIGAKTFTCGEQLVPCHTVPQHTTGGIPRAETAAIPPPTMSNGDTIYRCKAPKGKLFKVPNGDPAMAVHLGASATIKCKRQSGKIFLVVDTSETSIDPAGTDKFTCAEYSCQLCDQTKLLEPTASACITQKDFLCKSKPTVPITANCPSLSCPTGESLYLMQTATTGIPVVEAQVKCDPTSKSWLFDGVAPVDATAPGFVCATTCKMQCDTRVTAAYSNMDAAIADILMNPTSTQPSCTYKCPSTYSLTVSGKAHTSVVCNMKTNALTATGTTVSATNKFSCASCSCAATDLHDGSTGLCPKGFLCTNPTPGTACEANCPTDSMAIYNDAAGALKFSPTLTCAGADWITAGKATPDVACMFLPGKGYVTHPMTPPGTTVCTAITQLTCPSLQVIVQCPGNDNDKLEAGKATSYQFAELIYVKKDAGYVVTCKKGSLVTNMTEGIAQATCVQDDSQVAACLAQMDPAVAAGVFHECEFGACYISCADPTKQFEYTVDYGAGPVVEHNKLMKCHEMEPTPINLIFTDGTTIKCV